MKPEPSVAEIMTSEPTVVHARDRVSAAAREMEMGSFRHLPVVDDDRRVVGIVSQRDLLTAADGSIAVADVMSDDVKTVRLHTAAHEAAYLILRHKIGCVPVLDDSGRLVGILTDSDFVRAAYSLLGGTVPVDQLELEELEAERV